MISKYLLRPSLLADAAAFALASRLSDDDEGDPSSLTGGGRVSRKQSLEKLGKDTGAAGSVPVISPVIHVRAYHCASWFTVLGVWRKRRMIEGKGLPNFHNWRFITLTINPDFYPCKLKAYQIASDHMRRFLYACREAGLWKVSCKWCWKLEFMENGYPHWHLLVSRRSMLTRRELAILSKLWSMGRTNVERVNEKAFRYNFKYAFKPVTLSSDFEQSDEFERCAPDWFLDYRASKMVSDGEGGKVPKTVTYIRARFWQTSRGFYTSKTLPPQKPKNPLSSRVACTVRELLELLSRTVLVFSRLSTGEYIRGITLALTTSLENFWGLCGFDIQHGAAVGLGVFSFVVPHHRLTQNTQIKWQIQQLIYQNRLKLRHAFHLLSQGITLKAC